MKVKFSYASKYSVYVLHSWLCLSIYIQILDSQSAFSIFILLTDGGIHDLNATIEQVGDFYYY